MITSLWTSATPDGVMNKTDAIGYAVCHRISSHSFKIAGRPMPLCARCSGMYLGFLYGFVVQLISGIRKGGFSRKYLLSLSLMGALFIIDGLNSISGLILDKALLYPPQNWIRLITGLNMGVLLSALLYPIFTQTVWRTWQQEPALGGTRTLVSLLAGGIVLTAAMLSGKTVILIVLAILSVVGIMASLSLLYSVILLMLFRRENSYNKFGEFLPVFISGVVMMILHIGLFDLVRFLLTETWNGLPL